MLHLPQKPLFLRRLPSSPLFHLNKIRRDQMWEPWHTVLNSAAQRHCTESNDGGHMLAPLTKPNTPVQNTPTSPNKKGIFCQLQKKCLMAWPVITSSAHKKITYVVSQEKKSQRIYIYGGTQESWIAWGITFWKGASLWSLC